MSIATDNFPDYAAFWPFYLGEHASRAGRLVHVWGTLLALCALFKAFVCLSLVWLWIAPIIGYGAAWFAHSFIEKNHPATFTHPIWSLRGDFHMLGLWLSGRLEAELVRHKIMT